MTNHPARLVMTTDPFAIWPHSTLHLSISMPLFYIHFCTLIITRWGCMCCKKNHQLVSIMCCILETIANPMEFVHVCVWQGWIGTWISHFRVLLCFSPETCLRFLLKATSPSKFVSFHTTRALLSLYLWWWCDRTSGSKAHSVAVTVVVQWIHMHNHSILLVDDVRRVHFRVGLLAATPSTRRNPSRRRRRVVLVILRSHNTETHKSETKRSLYVISTHIIVY